MKRLILLYLLLFFSKMNFAQYSSEIWCFGDSAGIDFTNINNPIPYYSTMDSRGSCSSICDSSGSLLFYAFNINTDDSSAFVFDKTHQLMQNGARLIGAGLYEEITIVNDPGNSFHFYVFHIGRYTTDGFSYSIVDMNANGGFGSVIQKNVSLISNTRIADCVAALKHGNGRDWWIITKLSSYTGSTLNRFLVYLISPTGISSPLIQNLGNATDMDLQRIIINNSGSKLMVINFRGFMCEYDFDRCTGIISNPNIIFQEQSSSYNRNFWEGAYSPNDSLFYVSLTWYNFSISDTSRLIQFNLFDSNISTSGDTLSISKNPIIYGALRLAPDNKIYMASGDNWGTPGYPYPDSIYTLCNMNLGVINNPDSLGTACNFQPFSFSLGGKRTYVGLPNNPNYELGAWQGSLCDTLATGTEDFSDSMLQELTVFYHSGWEIAFINAKYLKGKRYLLQMWDMTGNIVFKEEGYLRSSYFTKDLNCSGFANGMYLMNLQTEKEMLSRKIIKN